MFLIIILSVLILPVHLADFTSSSISFFFYIPLAPLFLSLFYILHILLSISTPTVQHPSCILVLLHFQYSFPWHFSCTLLHDFPCLSFSLFHFYIFSFYFPFNLCLLFLFNNVVFLLVSFLFLNSPLFLSGCGHIFIMYIVTSFLVPFAIFPLYITHPLPIIHASTLYPYLFPPFYFPSFPASLNSFLLIFLIPFHSIPRSSSICSFHYFFCLQISLLIFFPIFIFQTFP